MSYQETNCEIQKLEAAVRRAAWQGLAVALALLLFAGGIYRDVLPVIGEVVGLSNSETWLMATVRITCHLAVGLGIPAAVICGLILTSRKGR